MPKTRRGGMFWSRKNERDEAVKTGCNEDYDAVEACETVNRFGFLHWKHPCSGVRNAYSTCKLKHYDKAHEKNLVAESLHPGLYFTRTTPERNRQLRNIQTRKLDGKQLGLRNVMQEEEFLKAEIAALEKRMQQGSAEAASTKKIEQLRKKLHALSEEDRLIEELNALPSQIEAEQKRGKHTQLPYIQKLKNRMKEIRQRVDEFETDKALELDNTRDLMRREKQHVSELRKELKLLETSPDFDLRRRQNASKHEGKYHEKMDEYARIKASHDESLRLYRIAHEAEKERERRLLQDEYEQYHTNVTAQPNPHRHRHLRWNNLPD